ncbi:hypothetical protein [Alicyclobacillus shizuokensis]|uniref:hypothetical protein n=1 Tax=Alicyclobacillus shizuokensis TaxID=392014 RepID=UPI000831D0E7|nr:hypothetical protein [Alicyclobacillus shizuokensis]
MAREVFSLVSDEVRQETVLRYQILNGQITPEVYATLDPDTQAKINKILFDIASEKSDPNIGASCLEFVLFTFMRLMLKRLNGEAFTDEDMGIQEGLNQILAMHEITNGTPRSEWLFDYLLYTQAKAQDFLQNRKEHIERKKAVIGDV